MPHGTARRACVVLISVAGLFLMACGGESGSPASSGSSAADGQQSTSTAGSMPSGEHAMTVDVTESEYSISMPQTELPPGMYTVAVSNTGQTGHDLVINGPGVDEQRTPVLDGGASD